MRGPSKIPGLAGLALIALALIAGVIYFMGGGRPQSTTQVVLTASGSTFVFPQVDAWAKEFAKRYPNIRIEYNPTGSGTGQAQFMQKVVDFAGSDPPLPTQRWEEARKDPRGVIQAPVIIGAIVMVYNIPGLEGRLKLDGEVIALIYLGEIRYWDDPKIKELNPDLNLPHEEIKAVHRSDSSGTTHVFTLFLYKASKGVWPREYVEKAIEWPVDKTGRGFGGKGNQGVAELALRTPYSMGYVEYSYAHLSKLPWALVRNAEGIFIEATPETMMEAVKNTKLPPSLRDDFNEAWDAVVYAPGKNSYPITSFTFLIFYEVYPKGKAEAIKKFIEFIDTEGQSIIVPGYVPIPQEIREYNLNALQLIREG